MATEEQSGLELRADPTLVWRPVVLYLAFGTLLSGFVVFTSLDVAGSTGDAITDFLLLSVFFGGVLIAISCPFWLWTAGRTKYSVGDGKFNVVVGRKIVGSWQLSAMRNVRLDGGAPGWFDLMTPFVGGLFPSVTFFTDAGRVDKRPIMLWGHDTAISVERALIAAISSTR